MMKQNDSIGRSQPYDPAAFLRQLAPHILADLKPPTDLMRFTTNTDIVGGYVEASVRQFVKRYLFPIRVCSGAVIDQSQTPGSGHIPQLDTIAWIPNPAPAVFEVGEFALVPRSSSLGVLEIKSSAYDLKSLETRTEPTFVKSVTADFADSGSEGQLRGNWETFGMGVVCLLKRDQTHRGKLAELRKAWRLVVLFEEDEDDSCVPQPDDIYNLVNFLAALRYRARKREGELFINNSLLRPPK